MTDFTEGGDNQLLLIEFSTAIKWGSRKTKFKPDRITYCEEWQNGYIVLEIVWTIELFGPVLVYQTMNRILTHDNGI